MKEERDALQRRVFPRLRALCRQRGARLQIIDLRWGVDEQATLNQQALEICLEEIGRCQRLSPKPNFLILLGDRYGWRPPPTRIPSAEFEHLLSFVPEPKQELLDIWYRRDDNADPPEYLLQPRSPGGGFEAYEAWEPVERALHQTLCQAAELAGFPDKQRAKYCASATHQEILSGALQVEDAQDHVLAFFRNITGLPHSIDAHPYIDLRHGKEVTSFDQEGHSKQLALKSALRERLANHVCEYQTTWTADGPDRSYIEQFCSDAYERLANLILGQIDRAEEQQPWEIETEIHHQHAAQLVQGFCGREKMLDHVFEQLGQSPSAPLFIYGEAGSGKSAVIARLAERLQQSERPCLLVKRFAGITPSSSDLTSLLKSLCAELFIKGGLEAQKQKRLAEIDEGDPQASTQRQAIEADYRVPSDPQFLFEAFFRHLTLAGQDQPICALIDGVDQLDNKSTLEFLHRLPRQLSPNIHLVLSLSPSDGYEIVRARLPNASFFELKPLTLDEGEQILDSWLLQEGRKLRPHQRAELLSDFSRSGLPLDLHMRFERSLTWTSYDDPAATTLPTDIDGLLDESLEQLINAQGHGGPLVMNTLGYLIAARDGLAEDELLDLLARDIDVYSWFVRSAHHLPDDLLQAARTHLKQIGHSEADLDSTSSRTWLLGLQDDPEALASFLRAVQHSERELRLPTALWARLYANLQDHLRLSEGSGAWLMNFAQPRFQEKALKRVGDIQPFHEKLADYFQLQPISYSNQEQHQLNLRKLSELAYQQACAKRLSALKSTLLDFKFLDARIRGNGPTTLLEDFQLATNAGLNDPSITLLSESIQLSSHVLERDRSQLPSQLVGRLSSYENEEIKALLERIHQWQGRPWLRPITTSLEPPGGPLIRTNPVGCGQIVPVDTDCTAVCGPSGDLLLIHPISGDVIFRLYGGEHDLQPLVMLASGHLLLLRGESELLLWTPDPLHEPQMLCETRSKVRRAAAFPGGPWVLLGEDDGSLEAVNVKNGQVEALDTRGAKLLVGLTAHEAEHRVFSVFGDGAILCWETNTKGNVICSQDFQIETNMTERLTAATAGREGELILGYKDGSIGIFETHNGEVAQRSPAHNEWVTAIKLDTDKSKGISGAFDGSLLYWDSNSGEIEAVLKGHIGMVQALLPLPDGLLLSASDNQIRCWDLHRAHTEIPPESVTSVAVAPDGLKAVAASDTRYADSRSYVDSFLTVYDLHSGEPSHRVSLGRHFWVNDLDLFPDDRRVICAGTYRRESLMIFDLKTGKSILPLPSGHSAFSVQRFSDGTSIISGGEDARLHRWDLGSFTETWALEGHRDEIIAVRLYGDEQKAISGGRDGTVRLWDLDLAKEMACFELGSAVEDLCISPAGTHAAVASRGRIEIVDLVNQALIDSINPAAGVILGMAYFGSDDLLAMATTFGAAVVINAQSGQEIARFIGEGEPFNCIAVSSRVGRMVVGGQSGAVHVLELANPTSRILGQQAS